MNTVPSRSRAFALVVGAGFTPKSDHALDQAARIASRIPGCELHVVRAIASTLLDARVGQIANQLEAYMTEVSAAMGAPLEHFAVHVRPGRASRAIVQVAKEVSADLIVLGAKETGLTNLLHGSVTKRTLAIAPCPVFVAGPRRESVHVEPTVIEPACATCLRVRAATHGAKWWCGEHARHHLHAHAYRYRREVPLRQHDGAITPTGVDMPDRSA